jgi:uncharacterized OsmC-like protein
MQAGQKKVTNGVDVNRLFQTIEDVKARPELAKFNFHISNRWNGGGQNQSEVKSFYGAGQEWQHAQRFTLIADEAEVLLGTDRGPNPVEYLLHALASCITSSMIYHAAAKGIAIQAVESTIEGDIDLRGFLGIDPSVRNGYQQIRMKFRIKADAPDEQIQELGRLGPRFSPVFDSVTNGVPVKVSAERMV